MRLVILTIAAVMLCIGAAADANLIPNPSFESGTSLPNSWRCTRRDRGAWSDAGAHFGQHCVAVDATTGPAAWRSRQVPASARQGMRFSGWLRVEQGSARLELHLLSADGRETTITPPVVTDSEWTYVAAEIPGAVTRDVRRAFVLCRAESGRAWFDGIRLNSLDVNILPNPGLSPRTVDDKPVASGEPSGWYALPETDERPLIVTEFEPGGPRALRLSNPGPSAASCYLVDLPDATISCAVQAAVRTDGEVTCTVSWYGPRGWIRDQTYRITGDNSSWTSPTDPRAPAEANRVRLSFALTRGTSALVRPLALIPVTRPQLPSLQATVFVNQVGYLEGGSATAIVGSTAFPARVSDTRFRLLDAGGSEIFAGPLKPLGRMHEGRSDDWGLYYWLADFTPATAKIRAPRPPGFAGSQRIELYRVQAEVGSQRGVSHPFHFYHGPLWTKASELSYRHFYYQRCGGEVEGWHAACHMDDARLPDGSHANLAGGWHDAGDYNKWMHAVGPSLALYGMSSAYLAHRSYFDQIDRDRNARADLLDEIMWGAEWLMRMRNPKTGGLYGSIATGWSYWGLAENETDNIPGNADDRPALDEDQSVSRAAAALAHIARIVPEGKPYLDAAIQLEEHSRKEGANPDRLLANLAIWQVTGDAEHLTQARACADAIAAAGPDGRQGPVLAPLALFVANVPDAKTNEKYRQALKDSMAWLASRQTEPFRLAAGRSGLDSDMEQASRVTQWGHHMELTSNAWAAAACAKALDQPELLQIAYNELDWLFGLNPLDLCMLHGAGSHHPARYHHRYSAIPGHRDGAVPGAIPNGIGRPVRQPDLDLPFMDEVNRDPSTDEPWIPYNGYYLCALAQMD